MEENKIKQSRLTPPRESWLQPPQCWQDSVDWYRPAGAELPSSLSSLSCYAILGDFAPRDILPTQSIMYFRDSFDLSFNTIYKILFRRFYSPNLILRTRLCGGGFITQPSCLISDWMSFGNDLYWRCTRFEKAFRRGRPLNILHDSGRL